MTQLALEKLPMSFGTETDIVNHLHLTKLYIYIYIINHIN